MKQHITEKQFLELSDKGKDKLREWWNRKGYTSYCESCKNEGLYIDEPLNEPFLSIGQMIEFLMENTNWHINITQFGLHNWILGDLKSPKPKGFMLYETNYSDTELCNCLWKAVKEILEKGKYERK